MTNPLGVAVLASGSGTNLQAILDRFQTDAIGPARVTRVIGSRPGIGAIERASRFGVPSSVLPADAPHEPWLLSELRESRADLVVLAGWLKMIPAGRLAANCAAVSRCETISL